MDAYLAQLSFVLIEENSIIIVAMKFRPKKSAIHDPLNTTFKRTNEFRYFEGNKSIADGFTGAT